MDSDEKHHCPLQTHILWRHEMMNHSQQLFITMRDIVLQSFNTANHTVGRLCDLTNHTVGTYEELANELTHRQFFDENKKPYTGARLRLTVHRWNKKNEDEDFRQAYYPKELVSKDDGLGYKQMHFQSPTKVVEDEPVETDWETVKKHFTDHEIKYFGWSETNLNLNR